MRGSRRSFLGMLGATPLALSAGLTRPDMPAIRAWYDRLCQRAAYQQHVVATPIT